MRKTIPETLFADREHSRLSQLNSWVLDNAVTEIVMTERQFWNFVSYQPVAETPWKTYMGRPVYVPDMPEDAQKHIGIRDDASGQI
jgi:hypothetical protein